MSEKPGNPLSVVVMAVAVVAVLSLVPWTRLSAGFFKDYDLFEDISGREIDRGEDDVPIDPLLESADSGVVQAANRLRVDSVEVVEPYDEAPRRDGKVMMEDYDPNMSGLSRFKEALAASGHRTVRIAVIGDSYIEGDIFTQDVRALLQAQYGGNGVGYIGAASDIEGFRRSVRQSHNGWTEHDIRTDRSEDARWLGGKYFVGRPGDWFELKGTSRLVHAASWDRATLLFRAPSAGELTVVVDGSDEPMAYSVEGGDGVQTLEISGEGGRPMTSLRVTNSSVAGLVVYGTWVNDDKGIALDCMSMRGSSGVVMKDISESRVAEMRRAIDYDLIVVEYGLNAISAKQKNYDSYRVHLVELLAKIKSCYPHSDIVLMGVGDRGQKVGTEFHSLAVVSSMVKAQRGAASSAGVVFWDTRAAMGGEDSCVEWHDAGHLNADYTHMSFSGGHRLAKLFVESLSAAIE